MGIAHGCACKKKDERVEDDIDDEPWRRMRFMKSSIVVDAFRIVGCMYS